MLLNLIQCPTRSVCLSEDETEEEPMRMQTEKRKMALHRGILIFDYNSIFLYPKYFSVTFPDKKISNNQQKKLLLRFLEQIKKKKNKTFTRLKTNLDAKQKCLSHYFGLPKLLSVGKTYFKF